MYTQVYIYISIYLHMKGTIKQDATTSPNILFIFISGDLGKETCSFVGSLPRRLGSWAMTMAGCWGSSFISPKKLL